MGRSPEPARRSPDVVAGLPPPLRVVETLRAGRLTTVLLADDAELGARVAVKVGVGAAAVDRLEREARALAAVAHPGVTALVRPLTRLADDRERPRAYIATRYQPGRSLAEVVAGDGRAPERWVQAVTRALLDALGAVHAAGIVHGDVSLANCLLGSTPPGGHLAVVEGDTPPSVLLLDLGACRFVDEPTTEDPVLGTPTTMAPELARGGHPTVASDLYAVACVAYELLVGLPPFTGATSEEILRRQLAEAPRPPREMLPAGAVSARFERALLRALSKEPERRFASAADFGRAIAAAASPSEGTTDHETSPSADGDDEDLRRRLLERVRSRWIEGVLQRTTDGVIMVRQRLHVAAAAAGGEAGADVETGLVTTEALRAAFERHPLLVILGEPGHGKTINLLRLARALLTEQGRVDKSPIPVVFAVSTWKRQPHLDGWMVDELVNRYDLSRREARRLVSLRRVLPLIDGLDDLPLAPRLAMIAAIREHRRAAPSGSMVITCRTAEYAELGAERPEGGVVELASLRLDELTRQLRAAEQSALLAALASSEQLTSLASTPMFLHVMRVSFRDSPGFRMRLGSEAATVAALFDAFIAVAEQRVRREDEALRDLRRHLVQLARIVARTGRTMLFYEDLQPSALPGPGSRLAYAFASRGISAALFTLSVILPVTFTPLDNGGLETSLAFTTRLAGLSWLVLTVTFALLAVWSFAPRRTARPMGVAASLAIALAVGAATAGALHLSEHHPMAAFLGFEVGFVGALVLGHSRRARTGDDDIVAAEEVRWSPRHVRPLPLAALALITIAIAVGFPLLYTITSGLYMAGAVLCIGLIVLGHRARKQEVRLAPNAGIHRTVRNALSAGGLSFAAAALVFGLSYGLLYGSYVGLTVGVVVALWLGGIDVIHHVVLRWQLHRTGALRLDAGRHLEAAVDAGLLRRVGHGYMFMHATLADHLARSSGPVGDESEQR